MPSAIADSGCELMIDYSKRCRRSSALDGTSIEVCFGQKRAKIQAAEIGFGVLSSAGVCAYGASSMSVLWTANPGDSLRGVEVYKARVCSSTVTHPVAWEKGIPCCLIAAEFAVLCSSAPQLAIAL
jgi:hypothetical protein